MRNQKIRRYIPSRQPTGAWDEDSLINEYISVPVCREFSIREPAELDIREPMELKAYLRFRIAWNNVKYVLAVLAGLFTGTGLVYLTLEAVIAIFVLLKRTFGG